jgi:Lysyl oxidase
MKVVALFGVAGSLVLVASGMSRALSAPPNSDVLPDLVQLVPFELVVTRDGDRFRLGFASAVSNVGAGPLIVQGSRRAAATPAMSVRQVIQREIGGWRTTGPVGELRYVVAETHQHWHLLPFDVYELRRADATGGIVAAFKSGFCLGDRYRENSVPPLQAAPSPYYRGNCGLGDRALLSLREGISTGYGDDYQPNLEGQSFDVTGLAAGEYVLTHVVNLDRRLRESDYANNAASLRISLTWPHGTAQPPAAATLAACPDSRTC